MSEAGSWLILRVIRPYSGGVWTLGYLLIADTKDSNLDLFWVRHTGGALVLNRRRGLGYQVRFVLCPGAAVANLRPEPTKDAS